ncbi:cytochrome P450 2J6-like [Pollicipes pollicipes]|uniref:cytochrome P450 2J6-like n=1 Tax=Pollicipes pollicipes TaxID=41117 RepID=UPI0018849497|nr:cytochrome P450 2J6-like [Pollicipes pollicipes]
MLAAVAVFVVLMLVVIIYTRNSKNRPPGPRGLPLIQQSFSMNYVRKEETFTKWRKQYGPIYQCSALGQTIVVLSDPDLIREAFSRPFTANRQESNVLKLFYADNGIIFSSGELWQQTRRFTLFHLRNFGMGRTQLEGLIQDQVSAFVDDLVAPNVGKAMSIDKGLRIAIANIIWGVVSSERFTIHDTRALEVMDSFDEVGKLTGVFILLFLFPVLERFPARLTGLDKAYKLFSIPMDKLFQPAIDEHARTVDLNGEPRDYIDCLLQEQHRSPDLFTNRHMLRSILDLFVAGYDTTTTTLRWAFCFLCSHPEVQRRLQAEVRAVAGDDMPYTDAFLMETQRVANVAPYGIEHVTAEEFQLGGFTVPQGAQIVPLLQAVHQDEALFAEPLEFRPERFLDAEGKLKPSRVLMPFSVGKRSCIGEAMARAELFLFVTAMVQRFTLRFPDGFRHDFSVSESKVLIREPTPFLLVAESK